MKYKTGETVVVGDLVFIEEGNTEGTVEHIVETERQMLEWGVDEAGVLIRALPFGTVFWPSSEPRDPVELKAREASAVSPESH